MRRNHSSLAVAAAFLVLAAGNAVAQEQKQESKEKAAETQEKESCRVSLEPAVINAQEEPVVVHASFSQKIGETRDAKVDESSGIVIAELETPEKKKAAGPEKGEKQEEGGEAEAEAEEGLEEAAYSHAAGFRLHLNAENAAEGRWNLEIRGTEVTCSGEIQVKPTSS